MVKLRCLKKEKRFGGLGSQRDECWYLGRVTAIKSIDVSKEYIASSQSRTKTKQEINMKKIWSRGIFFDRIFQWDSRCGILGETPPLCRRSGWPCDPVTGRRPSLLCAVLRCAAVADTNQLCTCRATCLHLSCVGLISPMHVAQNSIRAPLPRQRRTHIQIPDLASPHSRCSLPISLWLTSLGTTSVAS
jgi:hypothetical protein